MGCLIGTSWEVTHRRNFAHVLAYVLFSELQHVIAKWLWHWQMHPWIYADDSFQRSLSIPWPSADGRVCDIEIVRCSFEIFADDAFLSVLLFFFFKHKPPVACVASHLLLVRVSWNTIPLPCTRFTRNRGWCDIDFNKQQLRQLVSFELDDLMVLKFCSCTFFFSSLFRASLSFHH